MPSGAKKRKALKKKKQQEATGATTNNGGHDEHGSQDERGCDTNLSSPGSQGSEEFETKDPYSGDAGVTQGLRPQSGNAIVVQQGADYQKQVVEKSPISSSQNSTHSTKNGACQDACGSSISEISPVVDTVKSVVSVSKVGSDENSQRVDTSTHSSLVKQKSDEKEANPSPGLENNNSKVITLPSSAGETSKKVESVVKESEVPVSSEDKRLVLPAPPAVRTSWLSCCGLFDTMTGSDR